MRISGHTSLQSVGSIPDDLGAKLRELWIESAEEYVSFLAAVGQSEAARQMAVEAAGFEQAVSRAHAAVAAPNLERLSAARPGGALGCQIDPEILQTFQAERVVFPGRAATPPTARWGALPPAVRLMDNMPPTRNQGDRGACVAFASVALREYVLAHGHELSEQFLYWACKELDGAPGPGTYIHTAMTALSTYGTCKAATWPYNGRQRDDNEGQGPPPHGAVEEAKQFRMLHTRTIEPSLVDHYKHVLAGGDEGAGMPIVFAVLVFRSWYMSPETHRTGKITMPLPGEDPELGGHAMCVVGYVDDASVPGGGYFIVRNSWGDEWAADSPEAPGHAMIPYAYAERYAVEAFSGEIASASAPPAKAAAEPADTFEGKYVRTLKEDARDAEGKLVKAGARVLANPLAPGEFMEDSPANRQAFERTDCTWSPQAREKVWLTPVESASAASRAEFAALQSVRQGFVGALDENLKSASKQPVPAIRMPRLHYLLPWEPRLKQVDVAADLTTAVIERLKKLSEVPNEVAWPADWEELYRDLNEVRVYSLRGSGAEVHVVVASIAYLSFRPYDEPETARVDAGVVDMVRGAYEEWLKNEGAGKPVSTFFSIGARGDWETAVTPVSGGDQWVIVSGKHDEDGWQTRMPPRFACRLAVRDFLDRLTPETRQQRISRVKQHIDTLLDEGYGGNLTVDKVAKATGYRRSAVGDALLSMHESGHYRLYKTDVGDVAVDRKTNLAGGAEKALAGKKGFTRYLLTLLSPIVGVVAWVLKDLLLGRGFDVKALLVMIPLAYVGRLVDRQICRAQTEED